MQFKSSGNAHKGGGTPNYILVVNVRSDVGALAELARNLPSRRELTVPEVVEAPYVGVRLLLKSTDPAIEQHLELWRRADSTLVHWEKTEYGSLKEAGVVSHAR